MCPLSSEVMRVIQSYRHNNVPEWIQLCQQSVQQWAAVVGADYHCAGDDELLSLLPEAFKAKVGMRWPMLTDLGRLLLCRNALESGEERVVWLDADVLVVEPQQLILPNHLADGYAFGREIWIEHTGKVRRGVHNAICLFEEGNPMIDFYIHACERLIHQHEGDQLAPHLLGPKLLKALNPFLAMELVENVAMMSPAVAESFLHGGGRCANLFISEHGAMPAALNLCHSLLSEKQALAVCQKLICRSSS